MAASLYRSQQILQLIILTINRSYSQSKENKILTKQGRMLVKLITGSRKKAIEEAMLKGQPLSPAAFKMPQGKASQRRRTVLSDTMFLYITDMISTGEISKGLLGCGLEITRVVIPEDLSSIKVFWSVSEKENVDVIAVILCKKSSVLRHALIALRFMGNVPVIEFVKEESHLAVREVFKRLAVADFGPNFKPTKIPEAEIDDIILPSTSLQKQINENIQKTLNENMLKTVSNETLKPSNVELSSVEEFDNLTDKSTLKIGTTHPSLKSDIFGLDVDTLMKQVLSKRSRCSPQLKKNIDITELGSMQESVIMDRQREKELSKFLKSRRKAILKANKSQLALEFENLNIKALDRDENKSEDYDDDENYYNDTLKTEDTEVPS